MIAPKKILIPSDGNELEFVKTIKITQSKNDISYEYEYTYTKSATKTGNILFTERWLTKCLKEKIFIEIK